jgi:hypothetical protein
MVEDCHTSYDSGYGGGLRQPGTFIEFAKRKIDELNRFYTHSHAELLPTLRALRLACRSSIAS